jgi:hypothetical protein
MARLPHVLGVALAAVLAAGFLASAAPAVPIPRPTDDHTLSTTHFAVHYHTDILADGVPAPDYSSETQAGDIAAYAERAYATYISWGYPAPVNDGDGKIDIYLEDLLPPTTGIPMEGYTEPDGVAPFPSPDSGAITLDTPNHMDAVWKTISGLSLADEEWRAVANQVFVVFEFATWVPTNWGDYWLIDSSAQWAAFQAMGYPAGRVLTGLGPPDIALNCRDDLSQPAPDLLPFRMCDPDKFIEQGYTRWAFYQLLANKYGPSFVHNILVNGAAGARATTALANAIAAKGSSLTAVYNDYASRLLNGNFGVPQIASVRPPAFKAFLTGAKTFTTATVARIPANHLSARYVTFQRGDGSGTHACYAATLTVSVALPAGASSQPYFYWDVPGSSPQALSVSGSTASITVPWDTCNWGATAGWLSLPNASTSTDAADFTVSMSQTVDFNTPATATPPPDQTPIWGTTVPVPSTDVAPTIDVFGPELIKVSAKTREIRLIVDSSGAGNVNATLGAAVLGSRSLRAGNNDLRFVVPASLIGALRRSASAGNVLTLTPVSTSGAVTGAPVTRQVAITPAPKAKKKPKK